MSRDAEQRHGRDPRAAIATDPPDTSPSPPVLPPKARGGHFSDHLAKDAVRIFSSRGGREVSEADARRMLADLTDFCQILIGKGRENRN